MILAASSDPLERAAGTVAKHAIAFPVGYGLDAPELAGQIGAFYNDDRARTHLHATGFILMPDGTVGTALYSTGGPGRIMPADCISWIEKMRSAPPEA
jgi:hypothetical protein